MSDPDYLFLSYRELKTLQNLPISSRQFWERYGQEAGPTPPADSGLACNRVANSEAPAESRKVGQT